MTLGYFAGAAFRAFTTARKGPTLYDLCDPLLAGLDLFAAEVLGQQSRAVGE